MKNKDYISYQDRVIKLDAKTLKNLNEPEVLLKVLHYIAIDKPFSPKKEKALIQYLVDCHYDNQTLHEKKFFRILLLHAINLNHFETVKNLINKNSSNEIMNTFLWGNDIWPNFNSNVDWQRKRLSYTPLVMASYVRNAPMFKFILDKSDLTLQMKTNQFPLEQITEYLIASITHDTFEKNEMLMNFTQKIFYNCPEKMDKLISYYDIYKDYDLNQIIKTISVDNKKLDLNKIKNFSNEFVSYFEKIQLEKSLTEEKSTKKRMKI